MKLIFSLLLLTSFSVQANSPFMTVKERLRLHLWVHGIDEKPTEQVKVKTDPLPEELERALKKM